MSIHWRPLYISKLLSKCTSIHSSLHPCLPLLWIISDCLLMMSIRRHNQTTATTYKSFHCTEVFCCLNVHPFILLCTLVFLWLSSHDEYSETQSDNGYYLQVIPLYRSVLFSKCTSIHSSLHPCLPLLWIISDCVLIMSIQRNMKTPTSLLQVIPLYISKLLSKCTSIHSSLHPCLPLLWIISDCLLMMSIQRYMKTPTCLITSHSTVHK